MLNQWLKWDWVNSLFVLAILLSVAVSSSRRLQAEETPQFYDPVEQQIEGWTVAVDPLLLSEAHAEAGRKALAALANHLQRVKYIVSEERVVELQKLRIWVELKNAKLGNMQYHPDKGWLIAHGHDPRLAKHVHIPIAQQLLDRKNVGPASVCRPARTGACVSRSGFELRSSRHYCVVQCSKRKRTSTKR